MVVRPVRRFHGTACRPGADRGACAIVWPWASANDLQKAVDPGRTAEFAVLLPLLSQQPAWRIQSSSGHCERFLATSRLYLRERTVAVVTPAGDSLVR